MGDSVLAQVPKDRRQALTAVASRIIMKPGERIDTLRELRQSQRRAGHAL